MFVLTVTSDSAQSGSTSALVRLGAEFAAVGRRTLLLDVLPRTDIAVHLGLPPDAPRAGPRQVGPNFIYAGLDAAACSYEALAASEADVVVADIGSLGGAEARAFLSQVPASVLMCLRSSPHLAAAYANAMNAFNGMVSMGATLRTLGVFVSRHDAADLTSAQALAALSATTDLLCAPIPEAPGMVGPALVGSGMGEVYRAVAEAARSLVLEQQRQATPVKVGLGDLATAYQQSGKQIENQASFGGFPTDGGESASQYTYVLDSQALADVVGESAAPIVRHAEDAPAGPAPAVSLAPSTPAASVSESGPNGVASAPGATNASPPSPAPPVAPVVATNHENDEDEPREAVQFKKALRMRLMIAGAIAAAVLVGVVVLGVVGGSEPAPARAPEATPSTTLANTQSSPATRPAKEPAPSPTEATEIAPESAPESEVGEPARERKQERRKNRRKRRQRKGGAE